MHVKSKTKTTSMTHLTWIRAPALTLKHSLFGESRSEHFERLYRIVMLKLDVLVKDKDVIVSNQRLSDNVTSYLSITGIHVLLSECTIMPLARMNIIHYHS